MKPIRPGLFIDLEGLSLTQFEREILQHPLISGIVLFTRNYENPKQLTHLTRTIRSTKPEVTIATDQEGGGVQRFRPGFTKLPSAFQLGKKYRENPSQGIEMTQKTGRTIAEELKRCGIDLSFAPVLDLHDPISPIIGKKERAFDSDPKRVVQLGRAFIAGLHEAGLPAVGKHFPGHGRVRLDSHLTPPIDNRPFEVLRRFDLVPFYELRNELDGIMTAHITYPQIDPQIATFSFIWLHTILRKRLKFNGLVFTDDLSMQGAGQKNILERVQSAFQAGCDIGLVCNNRENVIQLISQYKILKKFFPINRHW